MIRWLFLSTMMCVIAVCHATQEPMEYTLFLTSIKGKNGMDLLKSKESFYWKVIDKYPEYFNKLKIYEYGISFKVLMSKNDLYDTINELKKDRYVEAVNMVDHSDDDNVIQTN